MTERERRPQSDQETLIEQADRLYPEAMAQARAELVQPDVEPVQHEWLTPDARRGDVAVLDCGEVRPVSYVFTDRWVRQDKIST